MRRIHSTALSFTGISLLPAGQCVCFFLLIYLSSSWGRPGAAGRGRAWRQAVNELFDQWSSTASPGNRRGLLPSRRWMAAQGPGVNEGAGGLAGGLMSAREPGGGQSSSSIPRDPLLVAPFSPIITVTGKAGKKRTPKGVVWGTEQHGVWTSTLTMQRSVVLY